MTTISAQLYLLPYLVTGHLPAFRDPDPSPSPHHGGGQFGHELVHSGVRGFGWRFGSIMATKIFGHLSLWILLLLVAVIAAVVWFVWRSKKGAARDAARL